MILWPLNLESKFALLNFLFGAVKLLTKNADPDHHSYSGHGIGFCSFFVHTDNRKKDDLIFCKGPTGRLDDTTLTAEAEYCINFNEPQQKKLLNLTVDDMEILQSITWKKLGYMNMCMIFQLIMMFMNNQRYL